MTEVLFAIAVVALSAMGLALGVLFGRDPVTTSCAGATRSARLRCDDCPLRRAAKAEGKT